jgi:transposase
VILTNARDAKGYKARKTDVIDAEWLADLVGHGLLKPSFIPPLPIRELRALTRYRESLVREQTALANRIQKLSESATIKLGHVASAARGVRGKLRLRAVAAGETDAAQMSHLAQRTRKRKQPQLQQAREGRRPPAQRGIGGQVLDQSDHGEAALQRAEERIGQEGENSTDPFVAEAVPLLATIPGVGETVAQILVAAIGVDMDRFPPDPHWASWAGGGRATRRARASARAARPPQAVAPCGRRWGRRRGRPALRTAPIWPRSINAG